MAPRKTARKKNPGAAVQKWTFDPTGEQFYTITARVEDGQYVSAVAIDVAYAPTPEQAAQKAIDRMQSAARRRSSRNPDDDERDHRLIQKGLKEPSRPLEDVLRDLRL